MPNNLGYDNRAPTLTQILVRDSYRDRTSPDHCEKSVNFSKLLDKENSYGDTSQSLDKTLDLDIFKKDHQKRVNEAIKEIFDYKPETASFQSSPKPKNRSVNTYEILNDITNCVNDMKRLSQRKNSNYATEPIRTSYELKGVNEATFRDDLQTKYTKEDFECENRLLSVENYPQGSEPSYSNIKFLSRSSLPTGSSFKATKFLPSGPSQQIETIYNEDDQDMPNFTNQNNAAISHLNQQKNESQPIKRRTLADLDKPNIPKYIKRDNVGKEELNTNNLGNYNKRDTNSRDNAVNADEESISRLIKAIIGNKNISNNTEEQLSLLTKALISAVETLPRNEPEQRVKFLSFFFCNLYKDLQPQMMSKNSYIKENSSLKQSRMIIEKLEPFSFVPIEKPKAGFSFLFPIIICS